MRYLWILFVLLPLMLLPSCNPYDKENKRLNEELKMVRQENDFLKAQIVGLKKELDELGTKVKLERAALEKKLGEERKQMQEKFQDQCEAVLKKAQEISKASRSRTTGSRERPTKERE